MKYLIWHNTQYKGKLLNVLLTNRSFAEIFEGDNPLYPVDQITKIHHKKYKITRFEKADNMVDVGVVATA